MTDHQILSAGAGHLLTARGNVMAFKAVAAQTGGDFSLMERTLPPGARRPPAHRHVNCSEAFFVLDGLVGFHVDGSDLEGRHGDFLLVPRGAAHTFSERGNRAGPAARAARAGHGRVLRRVARPLVRPGAARGAHRTRPDAPLRDGTRVSKEPGFAAPVIYRPEKADNVKVLVKTAED